MNGILMITLNWPPQFLKKVPSLYLVMISNTLEFFDLFLYIHMVSILHIHFFPNESFFVSESFALANIYFIAPMLSLFFALWGDTRGRKPVVIFCSVVMAISTFLMAIVPTYSQVGVLATGCFIFLRTLQGFSLAGEPYAAALYVIETVPIKKCPFYFSFYCATESLGSIFALLLVMFTLHYDLSWRTPFIGACIVVLFSLTLRYTLEETPDYRKSTELKTRIKTLDIDQIKNFYSRLPYKNLNTVCAGLVNFGFPFAFVTSYFTLGKHLRDFYGYGLKDIVHHNIMLSAFHMVLSVLMGYWASKSSISVGKIQVARMIFALACAFIMPFALSHYHSSWLVLFFQVVFVSCMGTGLVIGVIYKVFPVVGRFSLASMGHIGNRFISFFLMTFVLNYLTEQWGLLGNIAMMSLGCSLVFLGIYLHHPYTDEEFECAYPPFYPHYRQDYTPIHSLLSKK